MTYVDPLVGKFILIEAVRTAVVESAHRRGTFLDQVRRHARPIWRGCLPADPTASSSHPMSRARLVRTCFGRLAPWV
jgi:hypothetical protein